MKRVAKKVRWGGIVFLAILCCIGCCAGYGWQQGWWGRLLVSSAPPAPSSGVGAGLEAPNAAPSRFRAAPDFDLQDAQGRRVQRSHFQGRPILLHFWASWCAPCLDEFPRWVQLQQAVAAALVTQQSKFSAELKDKLQSLQWVAMSQDANWAAVERVWPALLKLKKTPLVFLLDPEALVSEAYGTFQFPETYLISAKQEILYKWVGPQDWADPKIIEGIVSRL